MLVVSFYTPGPYELEAKRLQHSLDRVQVPHEIAQAPPFADWYEATAYKAEFLYRARRKHTGGLLWLDADAVVHENIEVYFDKLEDQGFDLAARMVGDGRMQTGTLWLNDSLEIQILLGDWVVHNIEQWRHGTHTGGGQANLSVVLRSSGLSAFALPPEYCWIFDTTAARFSDSKPIIEHLQASRELRGGGSSKEQIERRQHRIAEITGVW